MHSGWAWPARAAPQRTLRWESGPQLLWLCGISRRESAGADGQARRESGWQRELASGPRGCRWAGTARAWTAARTRVGTTRVLPPREPPREREQRPLRHSASQLPDNGEGRLGNSEAAFATSVSSAGQRPPRRPPARVPDENAAAPPLRRGAAEVEADAAATPAAATGGVRPLATLAAVGLPSRRAGALASGRPLRSTSRLAVAARLGVGAGALAAAVLLRRAATTTSTPAARRRTRSRHLLRAVVHHRALPGTP